MAKGNELDDIKKEIVKEKGTSPVTPASPAADPIAESAKPAEAANGTANPSGSIGTKLGDLAKKMEAGSDGSGQATAQAGNPGGTPDGTAQATGTPAKPAPDMKKEINDVVKKKVDAKFSGIKDGLKGLEKISTLEGKLNQISEKLSSQMFAPPQQQAQPVQGGGTSISRELASFGEEVDFQSELYETKRTMAGIAKSLDTLNKKMEYRISILEDRSKALERIPDLEERLQDIRTKLGPENVQKLRKLIFSSDEIVDEVIPDLVNKKIRQKIDPAMNELRDMQETIMDFNSRLSHIKEEVLNLEKLRDDIQELKADKDNIYRELEENNSHDNERIDLLKQNIRRKIESVVDRFSQEFKDVRKIQADSIRNEVGTSFMELIEPRFADVEKKQEIVDDRLKRMARIDVDLDKKIASIEAPENIKKWLENKVAKLERGLIGEVNSLEKKTFNNAGNVTKLGEDFRIFHTAMADVPKRLGNQGNMINKLLDTKDFFAGRAEALTVETRSLAEKIAGLDTKFASLDERMASQESRFMDSLNRQREYLTAAKDDLSKHLEKELSGVRKMLEKKSQEHSRTTLAEFKAEFKRMAGNEEDLRAFKKGTDVAVTRLQKQTSDLESVLKEAYPEIKLTASRVEELEVAVKGLSGSLAESHEYHKSADSILRTDIMKHVDISLKALAREIDARRSEDAKAQLRELKDELKRLEFLSQELATFRKSQETRTDQITNELASLSGPLTDLKSLTRRVGELEDIIMAMDKKMDAEKDNKSQGLNDLAARLGLMEKAINDLGKTQTGLAKRVNQDNEILQASLAKVVLDKKGLEKEFVAQKTKMSELIRELKNV